MVYGIHISGCAFYPVKHEVAMSHEMDDVNSFWVNSMTLILAFSGIASSMDTVASKVLMGKSPFMTGKINGPFVSAACISNSFYDSNHY